MFSVFMIVTAALLLLASAVAAWRAWRRLRHFLHIYQLVGYKPHEFVPWLRTAGRNRLLAPSHGVGVGILVGVALGHEAFPTAAPLTASLLWPFVFASAIHVERGREKKPPAFTDRMRRQVGAALLLGATPVTLGTALAVANGTLAGGAWVLAGWLAADALAPFWVLAAGLLTRPVEGAIQEGFKRQARAALANRPDLTVLGITGSYGKTSTKFITAEVLRQRVQTLATPGSYNTPMGLCLVINETLRPDHRALVLEYGIRYPGDMEELTDLAQPDIAIVTSIGVAHLETMGSQEAIAREKGKLVEALRPGGQIILNADDERVAAIRERAPGHTDRIWTVSTGAHPDADLVASDVRVDTKGTRFTVTETVSGETAQVRTRLLGAHNISNLLLGLAAGRAVGLTLRQVAHAAARVEPIEHRLALRTENGVTVIDDAFNANPVGARNAVDILAEMPVPEGGHRAIVTPGMVELGERQAEENRAFGRHLGERLTAPGDLAVLVGHRQTEPIREGLEAVGFPESRLHVAGSLFEARDWLAPRLRDGDVVLYENDLPDTYSEE